jgi:hypothetical protein
VVYASGDRKAGHGVLARWLHRAAVQRFPAGGCLYAPGRCWRPCGLEMAVHCRRHHHAAARRAGFRVLPQSTSGREEDVVDERGRAHPLSEADAGYWARWQGGLDAGQGQEDLSELAYLPPPLVVRRLEQRRAAGCHGLLAEELQQTSSSCPRRFFHGTADQQL